MHLHVLSNCYLSSICCVYLHLGNMLEDIRNIYKGPFHLATFFSIVFLTAVFGVIMGKAFSLMWKYSEKTFNSLSYLLLDFLISHVQSKILYMSTLRMHFYYCIHWKCFRCNAFLIHIIFCQKEYMLIDINSRLTF